MNIRLSKRREVVSQSQIRSMTRECARVGGINMAQGICDLEVPSPVIAGAKSAMDAGHNIYTPTEGLPALRREIAAKMARFYGMTVDPETEVMVSAGATGAFYATCLALLDPGDEVILLEPCYGYHAATLAALACPVRFVRLNPPDWEIERAALAAAVTDRTRAIMLNTPANPSGKVFSRGELEWLSDFAEAYNLVVFTDEIYEHFVYDGRTHIPPATVSGLRERTVTISGFSKSFSITGWRLGYAICPPEICRIAAHFNDLIYVCAPAPLQLGAANGLLKLGPDYYQDLATEHTRKRDLFCRALTEAQLQPCVPQGAYYVLADISSVPGRDDRERVMYILEKTGVASVPGSAFYHDDSGRDLARFCFAKTDKDLADACHRLMTLR